MAPHIHRILQTNPFLNHALEGWATTAGAEEIPLAPNTRFPASFSVSQEGQNRCLYLAPTGFPSLHAALGLPGGDLAVALEGAAPRRIGWGDLRALQREGEIVHLPGGCAEWETVAQRLPSPLQSNLAEAVPSDVGGQVAISVQDGCHGVIASPDLALLARCLRGYLEEYQLAILGRDASLPAMEEQALAALLEPDPLGGWRALSLETGRRVWTLQIRACGEIAGAPERCWVSEGEGGRWRSGWTW